MKLEKIAIENFKGLKAEIFEPGRFSCLVGENNAGKSSVLQAITTGLRRESQLGPSVFYDQAEVIEFRMEFADIGERDLARLAAEHREKLEELVIDGRLVLITRYRIGQKVDLRVERQTPIDEKYRDDAINATFTNKRGAAVRRALVDSYPEFAEDAPEDINVGGAKSHIKRRIAGLPRDRFQTEQGPLPTGASASISTLLPEPIYIPAVKNLTDDLKTTQSTSFGRLLGLLLDDMTPDLAEITQALGQLNQFFNREERDGALGDKRHEKVRELETSVEGFLKENFPLVKVELRVPPPELRTILNSAQILIDDGSKDLVDNKGDGIKRSLTFALLQCYVQRLQQGKGAEGAGRAPLIFLFEEPELYLHPKSQRILFSTLERISADYQVVVTTHSPLFFAPGATASFVRVAKEPAVPKPIGRLRAVNFDRDDSKAEVFRMARFENADAAFFSRRVVLFEGESDDAFFKHVAKILNPEWDFDAKNVAMVRVSGKGNFQRFRSFFESFGIEVKIVSDLDAFFEGYHLLGIGDQVQEARQAAFRAVDARIVALGIKAEPASRQIKDKVTGDSWRQRYERAKAALRAAQENRGMLDGNALTLIDGLFTWEADTARVRACRQDSDARAALLPALTQIRAGGVHILSRGAIEDYYPDGTLASGPKPDRALDACKRITTVDHARALSDPLGENAETEIAMICSDLFSGL